MLVNKKILTDAVRDVTKRNALIANLRATPQHDKKYYYAHLLAYWLGDNTVPIVLSPSSKYPSIRLYFSYYHLFLLLDKLVSSYPNQQSTEYQSFQACQLKLFLYYNNHYALLRTDKRSFIQAFETILSDCQFHSECDEWHAMLIQFNLACNKLIQNMQDCTYQSELFQRICESRVNYHPCNIYTLSTKLISSFKLHPEFHRIENNNDAQLYFQKIVLPAADGTILDGLYLRPLMGGKDTIVLALIGHFQAEDNYISSYAKQFYDLFNTDIVFVNHRNYSSRSAKFANSSEQLAQDLAVFAEFAAKHGKQIVLYGMCGGAGPTLLAAKQLDQKKIKYKLILDRMSNKYHDFFDFKTTYGKFRDYANNGRITLRPSWEDRLIESKYGITLLLPLIYLLTSILRWLCIVSNQNQNFGELAQTIHPHNLLILQAKGSKRWPSFNSKQTDIIVHPSNNLRNSVRDTRLRNKSLLNQLLNLTEEISDYCAYTNNITVKELGVSFRNMATGFKNCLKLISSEKLQKYSGSRPNECLHSEHLYGLSTRHHIPINQFIQGFFTTPTAKTAKILRKLANASIRLTVFAVGIRDQDRYGTSLNSLLSAFLICIDDNHAYISYMLDRVSASGLGDMSRTIQSLLDSPILAVNPYLQQSMSH